MLDVQTSIMSHITTLIKRPYQRRAVMDFAHLFCARNQLDPFMAAQIISKVRFMIGEGAVLEQSQKRSYTANELQERIENVLKSKYRMEKTRDSPIWDRHEKMLKTLFPYYQFNFIDLEVTLANGNVISIAKLKLEQPSINSKDPEAEEKLEEFREKRNDMQRAITWLLNKKKDLETILSPEKIDEITKKVSDAIIQRDRDIEHQYYLDRFVGKYPIDEKYQLYFSTDPIDIIQKSTGRAWHFKSCERIGGQFQEGNYDDIAHNNAVVFVEPLGGGNPEARIMVRWCHVKDEAHQMGVGIEYKWYYLIDENQGESEEIENDDNFIVASWTAHGLYEKLKDLLRDMGGNVDYSECITPYDYKGYSDQERHVNSNYGGETRIHYGKAPTVKCNNCGDNLLIDDAYDFEGNYYCSDCIDEYRCDSCDRIVGNLQSFEGESLCATCYSRRSEEREAERREEERQQQEYVTCNQCGEDFHRAATLTYRGQIYCQKCYQERKEEENKVHSLEELKVKLRTISLTDFIKCPKCKMYFNYHIKDFNTVKYMEDHWDELPHPLLETQGADSRIYYTEGLYGKNIAFDKNELIVIRDVSEIKVCPSCGYSLYYLPMHHIGDNMWKLNMDVFFTTIIRELPSEQQGEKQITIFNLWKECMDLADLRMAAINRNKVSHDQTYLDYELAKQLMHKACQIAETKEQLQPPMNWLLTVLNEQKSGFLFRVTSNPELLTEVIIQSLKELKNSIENIVPS